MHCPLCGNTQLIPLSKIYLLVKDPNGPIHGREGRYYCAGDHQKKTFDGILEGCTTEVLAVTNPACKRTKEYKDLMAKEEMRRFYQSGGLVMPSSVTDNDDSTPGPEPSPPTIPPAPAPSDTPEG
ncbi:MAG: hypothetical protein JNJ77_20070 [Planctomycetia bacterium]|nr:hypothetical protein [Planctomycetia bacterium]